MVMRPETVDMIWDIQKEFFLNIGDLPTRLVQKHVTKFMQMVEEERIKYENITWDEYDKPKRIIDKVDQVHELHHFYIGCKKDISKELLQIMKKNIGQRA